MRYLPIVGRRPNDDRLFVKVFVQGTGKVFWTNALVDTGATGIAVSPFLARRASAVTTRGKSGSVWAFGGRLRSKDAALLIKCGPAECRAIIDVLRPWARAPGETPHEMILGWNWIESFGAVIDSARRRISVREWHTRDLV